MVHILPWNRVLNHPITLEPQVFERKGIHLYTRLTISLLEALTGFSKAIKHLDGEDIVIERDAVTQPGRCNYQYSATAFSQVALQSAYIGYCVLVVDFYIGVSIKAVESFFQSLGYLDPSVG